MAEYGLARLELVDLKPRLASSEVQNLLYTLVGWRDDEALNRVALEQTLAEYRDDDSSLLYGVREVRKLVGVVGFVGLESASADLVIRHLVVHPGHRAAGLGRGMIGAVCERWQPDQLAAETDASAVDFYRRCGFSVRSLGETYPGVERSWCVLRLT